VRVHINDLISGAESLKDYRIIAFGGGFSWGDDHGAGVIQAVRMKTHIGKQLLDFIDRGNLVIGICNGFQALVNLGLLPGLDGDYTGRSVALTPNQCGNFRNDWVHLAMDPKSPCIFTREMSGIELPVRHGEGKFFTDPSTLRRLCENRQIVMRYALADGNPAAGRFPDNPNGSLQDVAGICDPTGRVFGLMPHPEAYNHWTNHPGWTRKKARLKAQGKSPEAEGLAPGIRLFKNAVDHASGL
jgi:phosphoribosylformylglycinamidine synthase